MPTGPSLNPPPKAPSVPKGNLFTVSRSPGDSKKRVVPQSPYPGIGSTDRHATIVPHLPRFRNNEEAEALTDFDDGSELLQLQ